MKLGIPSKFKKWQLSTIMSFFPPSPACIPLFTLVKQLIPCDIIQVFLTPLKQIPFPKEDALKSDYFLHPILSTDSSGNPYSFLWKKACYNIEINTKTKKELKWIKVIVLGV